MLLSHNCSVCYCNQHKARNLLKRVAKMEVRDQDGEDFERANLLLAKFYVDNVMT